MFYSIPAIVGLLAMLVLNYDVLFNKNYQANNKLALKAYKAFLITVTLYFICDIVWGYLEPLEDKRPITICTTIYFIMMMGSIFTWTLFVTKYVEDNPIFKKVIKIVGYIFATVGNAVIIVNIFYPLIFTYKDGAYLTTTHRSVLYGCQVLLFALSSLYAIINSRQRGGFKRTQMATIASVGAIMTIAIAFQMYHPEYPIYTAGLVISLTFIHVFIVSTERKSIQKALAESQALETKSAKERDKARKLAYLDALTGAKNKHAFVEFEAKVDQLIHDGKAKDFALLIFDLNDLKVINDKYGHEMGDQYIIKSYQLIKKYFPGVDVYRYGGDEFVLLLEGKAFDDRYQKLDAFNELIDGNINKNEPVIAAGISEYIRDKDNVLRNIFLRADERMYGRKKRLKRMALDQEAPQDVGNKAIGGSSAANLRYEMYEMFYNSGTISLVDMLNASNCDEVLEFNIPEDTFKQLYHVQGKYFVPNIDVSYKALYDYTYKYVVHPDDRGIYENLMKIDGFFDRLRNARIPNFDFAHFRYKLADGEYRYVEQIVIAGKEFGIPEGTFRMYVIDIDNIKSRQLGKISDDTNVISVGRDPITGLLTGKDFFKAADAIIEKETDKDWCLASIDIEHFKLFDEWFGREKGDLLLATIGAELKKFEEDNGGVAGYIGADDFVILLQDDPDKVLNLYNNIHEHIMSFGLSTGFLPAIGLAALEEGVTLFDAFDRSTIAMTKAKNDLKNRIYTYNYDMQFSSEYEYRILTDFIHALQDDEITFYLQPQVRLSTGQIVGVEALARWIKKDGTIVPPGDFIPVLEKFGFITDLDKRIWEKVFSRLHYYLGLGKKAVPVSLNVSQIDIFNIDVVQYFSDLSDKYQIPRKLIKVEITESAYAESMEVVNQLVNDLRGKGFTVILDDFGSGYSSLNMLSTLKLDAIKLDAKFLHLEKRNHERGIHILESVVNLVKSMSLPIIVEGAETKEQAEYLKELGVQYVQGYFFYKPMPYEAYEEVVADQKKLDPRGFVLKVNEQFRLREFLDTSVYSDAMLNSILGAVAIYSLSKDGIDIVRFNQQFYESVGVPGFSERLKNIEQWVPEDQREELFDAFRRAKENRLTGASIISKFLNPDGTYSSFKIQLYHLSRKDGVDRFYGSATNVTELSNLREEKELVAKYSEDNIIFINKVSDKWHYSVISHALSDDLGLLPTELEEELNSGKFATRVSNKKALQEFMKRINEDVTKKDFSTIQKVFTITSNSKEKLQIQITIDRVDEPDSSVEYILRSRKLVQ